MGRTAPQIFTIPSGIPFARALAEGVVQRTNRDPVLLADALVLVPTRRAARTLRETFTLVLGGAALLPKIRALGDIDEDELNLAALGEDLTLPAIAPLRRRLLLAKLVQK